MPTLNLSFLGAPRVELDHLPVEIPARKAVALLAYLAITGQPVTRERLAAFFWPESDSARARGALRSALITLRQAVGEEWITAEGDTLALRQGSSLNVDVNRFRAALATVRSHNHASNAICAECRTHLIFAVEIYRDEFLSGFSLPDCPAFDE